MIWVEAILLGTAQDAGVPQVGCICGNCAAARAEPALRRTPASLGLVDHGARRFWMIDATPAFPAQADRLNTEFPEYEFSGIFLSHAHIGHYSGLVHLGKEAWNLSGLPLFATSKMIAFLEENEPWRNLVRRHLVPNVITPDEAVRLSDALTVRAVAVHHRAEHTDTLAFWVETDASTLFYCPDIDRWTGFPLDQTLEHADHALLDATFYSPDELPGRDLAQIPHPMARDTLRFASGRRAKVWLIHLNHSNPLCRAGRERDAALSAGAGVAEEGQRWLLN